MHTPVYRDSTAVDQRSIGSGIFQFRESQAKASSQSTLINLDEAPVPSPFTADQTDFFNTLASHGAAQKLPICQAAPTTSHIHPWSVYCNECDASMVDAHFHCSICDGGDYDLCEGCVAAGKLCQGEDHWLIKRSIKDGRVVNSTTERISPRKAAPAPAAVSEVKKEMPGTFAEDVKASAEEPRFPTRTCNSCVVVLPEREFVTCVDCDDFDLCIGCHTKAKHGHHPAHTFKQSTELTMLPLAAETMLAPGRNVRHYAICDGCDKNIYGVRNKCLDCPDFDYCNDCVKNARLSHARHRFAPIYAPIAAAHPSTVRHFGIYCDGDACNTDSDQSYITGVRYKCAVCNDTDFCAGCEASPANHHNRTHPLIMFKTAVRNVSITTENEDMRGNVRVMGDRRAQKSASTETVPEKAGDVTATPVYTMAETKPVEKEYAPLAIPTSTVQGVPIPVIKSEEKQKMPAITESPVPATLLNALFMQDSIPDGMAVEAGSRFTQIWTVKNHGPLAWPAGCSIRYVGGDNMFNVDNKHVASVSDIADATESNVVGRPVQVGEEIAFKVVLKAPSREGKCISYWRLKAADGTPFGHRLWCDVDVKLVDNTVSAQQKQHQDMLRLQQQMTQNQQMQMQKMLQQRRAVELAQMQARAQAQAQAAARQAELQKQVQAQAAARQAEMQKRIQAQTDAHNASLQILADRAKARTNIETNQAAPSPVFREPAPTPALTAAQREMMLRNMGRLQMGQPPAYNDIDNSSEAARKEAAMKRVAFIKAKILKTREERSKALEAEGSEEKVKKIIEEVSKTAAADVEETKQAEEKMEGSQMVFPKLEKESPASSTMLSSSSKGKAATVENEQGEVEAAAAVAPKPAQEPEADAFEEIEVLSANDGEDDEMESEDGFLTDDEWDVLDASDAETAAEEAK